MVTSKTTTNPLLTTVWWTERISSILVIGVFLLMFFGEGFDPAKVKPNECNQRIWMRLARAIAYKK